MGKPKRVPSPALGGNGGPPPLKKARNPLLNQNNHNKPMGGGLPKAGGMSQLASRLLAAQPPPLPKQPMPLGAILPTEPEPPTSEGMWAQPSVELKEDMDREHSPMQEVTTVSGSKYPHSTFSQAKLGG